MPKSKYTGSCYIGVVGGEMENGLCRDSIQAIKKRRYDEGPYFIRATKGFEARQMHLNNWYDNTKRPFLLLLDHDMIFPENALERLRSHGLPYVSGWYPRRTLPTAPIWFNNNEPGHLPFLPMSSIPEDNSLLPIGASGWGCMLIHRDVVTATKKILKGEPEIIEDDMDVLPYSIKKIVKAINILDNGLSKGTLTAEQARKQVDTLKAEFVPLRAVKDNVGSDIRFPFYAKLSGFQMYGDSGVKCWHMTNYPIKWEDYTMQSGIQIRELSLFLNKNHMQEVEKLQKAIKR